MAAQFCAKLHPRPEEELRPGVILTEVARRAYVGRDLEKLYKDVTAPIGSKFKHYRQTNGVEGLVHCYEAFQATEDYMDCLKAYEMESVFMCLTNFDEDGYIIGDGNPINLLEDLA